MKSSTSFLRVVLLFLGISVINHTYAASVAPNWSLNQATSFPSSLIVGQTYALPLSISNQNTIPLIISAILPNTIPGLTIAGSNDCIGTPVAPGTSCTFTATYTPASAGTVNLQIQLAAFGYLWKQKKSINLTATSAETTATIASSVTNISLAPSTVVNWTITNSSSTVTATNITTVLPSPLSNYATVNTCATTAPGATCTLTLTVNADLPKNLTGTLTAQGDNTNALTASYESSNSLSIAVESDSQYHHLAYQAIKVTNPDTVNHTISAIAATLPSNIIQCDGTASNCDNNPAFESTCAANTILAANTSCHIWYKSVSSTTLGATTTLVSITVTTESSNVSSHFNFNYENDLYVGGIFNSAGGQTTNNIAKWDGTNWSNLDAGVTSSIGSYGSSDALALFNGDLYVGGSFDTAGETHANNIAKWNGANWSTLGSGESAGVSFEGSVHALAAINNTLYVGGEFVQAGGQNANNIAQWDGSNWSSVGTGTEEGLPGVMVNALTSTGSDLYAGGFSFTDGAYFTKWDGSNWSNLRTGTFDYIKTLTSVGNNLYVGGEFFDSAGNVAEWNGSTFSPLGSGTTDEVYALARVGNDLYVGGQFEQAGDQYAKFIAQWDGNNWSVLGSNDLSGPVNVSVQAILAAPSLTISLN